MRPKKPLKGNDLFFAVMKKTRGRCYYCGDKKWPVVGQRLEISIDHFVPSSRGGSDEIENLVPACRTCNSAKCAGTVEELRHHVAMKAAGMPKFSREQIAWMRKAGADLSKYDSFRFWFEKRVAHKSAHGLAENCNFESETNDIQNSPAVL